MSAEADELRIYLLGVRVRFEEQQRQHVAHGAFAYTAVAAALDSQHDVRQLAAMVCAVLDWADRHAARACAEGVVGAMLGARDDPDALHLEHFRTKLN